VIVLLVVYSPLVAATGVELKPQPGKVAISIDGQPFATYSYEDDRIPRPYFSHVHAPSGTQVTRNHPPVPGQDLTDHDTFHPGIWMAFGDINGSDYWRCKAPIKFVEFAEQPTSKGGKGSFAARYQYLEQQNSNQVVCEELAKYTIVTRPEGTYLLWDSTFSGDDRFAFGDQEEMGLGFRVATPIRVEHESEESAPPGNGTMTDSQGRKNGDQIWGNSADWCDYSGTLDGQHVGMTLFCHPDNFRPSWFHARDYGFMAANPFGREAFSKGAKSSVVVEPGEKLRLRYGVFIHSAPKNDLVDLAAAFEQYKKLTAE
jgi:hypothetical protein